MRSSAVSDSCDGLEQLRIGGVPFHEYHITRQPLCRFDVSGSHGAGEVRAKHIYPRASAARLRIARCGADIPNGTPFGASSTTVEATA